jgi:hypothetical protein
VTDPEDTQEIDNPADHYGWPSSALTSNDIPEAIRRDRPTWRVPISTLSMGDLIAPVDEPSEADPPPPQRRSSLHGRSLLRRQDRHGWPSSALTEDTEIPEAK